MAATSTAVVRQTPGASVAAAYGNVGGTAQNLDILQIIDQGGKIVLNVDYAGVVHNPASGATNGTRIGQFQTSLAAADTTAHYFANAFTNPALLDILQIINVGGNVSYYIDYLGVAHGS
jgi:hypothetical protein